MVKWFTSLILFLALTGQVWAGVCGCFEDHSDTHSCCAPDKSGKLSFSAKACCSQDCQTLSSPKTPGKINSDNFFSQYSAKFEPVQTQAAYVPQSPLVFARFAPSGNVEPHGLALARPPTRLYLRHNSFLI